MNRELEDRHYEKRLALDLQALEVQGRRWAILGFSLYAFAELVEAVDVVWSIRGGAVVLVSTVLAVLVTLFWRSCGRELQDLRREVEGLRVPRTTGRESEL